MEQNTLGKAKMFALGFLAAALLLPGAVVVAGALSPAGEVFTGLNFFINGVQMDVRWDEASNAVHLTEQQQAVTLPAAPNRDREPLRTAGPFFDRNPNHQNNVRWLDSVTMGGNRYSNALSFRGMNGNQRLYFTLHNLNSEFNVLSGHIGRIDGTGMVDATVRFFGDGALLGTYQLRATDLPIPFSVDVSGVRQLMIEAEVPHTWALVEYAIIGYLE